jgi:hypothetical protein
MTQTVLHFVFTTSGAGSLVQALRKAGLDDPVIATFEDLSFGPIHPSSDRSVREKWIENELGRTDFQPPDPRSEHVWNEARFPDNRKVAWLTRRSASEYAGFLDWLWRLGDEPCDVVDLTDVTITYPGEPGSTRPPELAVTVAMLNPDTICREKLWELAEPLQAAARRAYRENWRQLRDENAPLRVIDAGKLVSAPISFFDSVLTSKVTESWRKVARVLGDTIVFGMDDNVIQAGDTILMARINALVESGHLEIRGESAFRMCGAEVRLARR